VHERPFSAYNFPFHKASKLVNYLRAEQDKGEGTSMKPWLFVICLIFSAHAALAADCNANGPGDSEMSCPPGSKIDKNGSGNLTLYLKDGSYTVVMNGPGNLHLRGISDYSHVTGEKNGDGVVFWCPVDDKAGLPPSIKKDGNGGTQKGC